MIYLQHPLIQLSTSAGFLPGSLFFWLHSHDSLGNVKSFWVGKYWNWSCAENSPKSDSTVVLCLCSLRSNLKSDIYM